jgi:hypothetical protein
MYAQLLRQGAPLTFCAGFGRVVSHTARPRTYWWYYHIADRSMITPTPSFLPVWCTFRRPWMGSRCPGCARCSSAPIRSLLADSARCVACRTAWKPPSLPSSFLFLPPGTRTRFRDMYVSHHLTPGAATHPPSKVEDTAFRCAARQRRETRPRGMTTAISQKTEDKMRDGPQEAGPACPPARPGAAGRGSTRPRPLVTP